MKTTGYILGLLLCIFFNNALGTITGISIRENEFQVSGLIDGYQYSVTDLIYAEGRVPEIGGPHPLSGSSQASSRTGFLEDSINFHFLVSGYYAETRGEGYLTFTPTASQLTVITDNMDSVIFATSHIELKDITANSILYQGELFRPFIYTWEPIQSHIYSLNYSGALSINSTSSGWKMEQGNINVVPEPTTLLLLGMGGVLIRKR